ncbi:hypothetical protein RG64_09345 [Escherichia coli]|uniref:hypothetical protein n=1 Tax=Escherichia coli TaxID=562 RepID=UPI00092DB7CF|nr:hypothetical protein [Escherichia coli]APL42814.1 hypothetical protein RG64_09345 [Escherichia coli]
MRDLILQLSKSSIYSTKPLNGYVQVREGLKNGDQVVTYSEKALTARSRIHVVEHIPGVSR